MNMVKSLFICTGVSANTTATRVFFHVRQKGSSVQQEAVTDIGANFESLIYSSLLCSYLSIEQFEKRFPGDN